MKQEWILGYPVAAETVDGCLDRITYWLQQGERRKFFACTNPHSLVVAEGDSVFREALLSAHLLTPDGVGILHGSRILGRKIRHRVTGSDIFFGLSHRLDQALDSHYSYFFLGASEHTLRDIQTRLARDYPNIRFAGSYSPPFKPEFDVEDNHRMIAAINAVKPDVLWVGMTAPKQEKWIYQNLDRLDIGFVGAIGAVFDFYTGRVKRSHPIFQRLGLEWLPRLIQEPRRLWRRNFVSTPKFLWMVLSQRMRGSKRLSVKKQ
ncbi:MAG: WecB/TagA/CpsF family glycosyltransferase [Desulfuromonadales bacterium]|nr:WecB/TagA/CpsF family glycosyltransferase [Desulfuromonadales bacterium]